MWTSALMTAAFFALVTGDCHRYEDNFYRELGCKPGKVGNDGCPMSYDCSIINKRDKTKCYFKGKGYNKGDEVRNLDPCVPLCSCKEMPGGSHIGEFKCVRTECPENLHPEPYQPGCRYLYEPGNCCSTGRVCSNSTSDQTTNLASKVCRYKSEEYQLGQHFYPDEDPCLKCTCMAGFAGNLVQPYCTKINCHMELYNIYGITQGCAPSYYGTDSCCPISWRCPEKSDSVIPAPVAGGPADLHCQFGTLVMKIGDKLNPLKSEPETECTCRVPPRPICIQKKKKENWVWNGTSWEMQSLA